MDKNDLHKKLADLASRANSVKTDTKLRHQPSEKDLQVASENANLAQLLQYQTIKPDRSGDNGIQTR